MPKVSHGGTEAVANNPASGRQTDEWVGSSPDAAIPKRVKLRVLLAYGGKCHRTGHKFRPGDRIEYDHVKALCNGGENRESNLAPILGGKPHQAKTAADVAERVKIDRLRAKHLGLWPEPKRKLQSRGFDKRPVAARAGTRVAAPQHGRNPK
jgi:5-methylcytosine-specific restriction enzyme A